MIMKRRAPEPELCHFDHGSTALVKTDDNDFQSFAKIIEQFEKNATAGGEVQRQGNSFAKEKGT